MLDPDPDEMNADPQPCLLVLNLLFDVQVTYSGSEGSSVVLSGLSSDPGQGVIIAARDYERQFSAHFVSFFSHLQLRYFSGTGTAPVSKQYCEYGIRCLFDPWIRDPEKVFSGSRIPKPYFES